MKVVRYATIRHIYKTLSDELSEAYDALEEAEDQRDALTEDSPSELRMEVISRYELCIRKKALVEDAFNDFSRHDWH